MNSRKRKIQRLLGYKGAATKEPKFTERIFDHVLKICLETYLKKNIDVCEKLDETKHNSPRSI